MTFDNPVSGIIQSPGFDPVVDRILERVQAEHPDVYARFMQDVEARAKAL